MLMLRAIGRFLRGSEFVTWADMLKSGEFGAIADWFTARFTFFGVLVFVTAAAAAWLEHGAAVGIRVLSLSILVGAASTGAGWVLGLLFGVPRSLARDSLPESEVTRTATDGQQPSSRVNTNLEDISDWLTKTIVGVGLTQLFSIPDALWSAAGKVNAAGIGWPSHGQLLALALFIYGVSGGFWLGYVGTRTVLTKLLKLIDEVKVSNEAIKKAAELDRLQISISGTGIEKSTDPEIQKADAAILALPREKLVAPREIAAWGAAKARNGELLEARVALEQALKAAPNDLDIKQLLARILTVSGSRVESRELAKGAPDTETDVLNALYEKPPEGFEKAIRIGSELAAREGSKKSAQLHMWLACAYGQQYGFLLNKDQSPDQLSELRARVLQEIDLALGASSDPQVRKLLYLAWKPPAGYEDNDLSGFPKDDPDFVRRLEPAAND